MKPVFFQSLLILYSIVSIELNAQNIFMDIEHGAIGSNPKYVGDIPGGIVFSALTEASGRELWFTDGSTDNTYMLIDANSGTESSDFTTPYTDSSMTLLFINNSKSQVWSTNGTSNGTVKLIELYNQLPDERMNAVIRYKDKVYFSGLTQDGYDICVTDGTPQGTKGIIDIEYSRFGIPLYFNICNGKMYFVRQEKSEQYFLYESDGTQSGTRKIMTIDNLMSGVVSINNNLYFSCYFSSNTTLYRFNPEKLKLEIIFSSSQDELMEELMVHKGRLYFNTYNADIQKCWYTDSLTQEVRELKLSDTSVHSSRLVVIYNYKDFSIGLLQTDKYGYEYWKLNNNGTAQFILDLSPGSSTGFNFIKRPIFLNGKIYFQTSNSANGTFVWRSDATTENTKLAYWFQSQWTISELCVINKQIYIMGNLDSAYGSEIYGPANNISTIVPINKNIYSFYPNPVASGGILHIHHEEPIEHASLLNICGQLIFEFSDINSLQLPEHLPKGIYFILLNSLGIDYRFKIVIE